MKLSATLRSAVALVALLGAFCLPALAAPTAVAPAALAAPLGVDTAPAVVPYAQFLRAAGTGNLNAAVVDGAAYWVAGIDRKGHVVAAEVPRPKSGADFGTASTDTPTGRPGIFTLADWLRTKGVAVVAASAPAAKSSLSPLQRYVILPLGIAVAFAFIVGVMLVIRGRNPAGRRGGGAQGHGRIRKTARIEAPATRFDDVAGCDECVEELKEVVTFLKEPERFAAVGARMPRGVILFGPPGTGKTLLAKAVAGEAGVPFYALSGSDFVDTFVGVGSARVRDLFAEARKQENGAIIFFDEIDAIGKARSGGPSGADSEREATLNQLLVELDGFGTTDRVVVMAATNRIDMLDQALTRPGRFDRRVQVGLPAEAGRLAILGLYAANKPFEDVDDLAHVATITAGFAGADLANLLNEAAIMTGRAGRTQITSADLDEGMLRAIAGPEKRDRRIAPGELETIAWHEAGHCLAAELCPTHQKTQRVTILARGDSGGLALFGSDDRTLTSPQQLHERMVVAMAGRAAEQVGFGVISSGAANDLEQANSAARSAVEQLGFSPIVGQIAVTKGPNAMQMSEDTRRSIDIEISAMVDAAYRDAVAMMSEHRDELEALAAALLEREQIDRSEIEDLLGALAASDQRRRPLRQGALPTDRRIPVVVAELPTAEPEPGRRGRVPRPSLRVPLPPIPAAALRKAGSLTAALIGARPKRRARGARADRRRTSGQGLTG
jgi:cell division protease FtsH